MPSIANTILSQLADQGDNLFNADRFAEAERKYREMLPFNLAPRDRAITVAKIGRALYLQGKNSEAETTFLEATSIDQASAFAWTYLACFWGAEGKTPESRRAGTYALDLLEDATDSWVAAVRQDAERLMLWHRNRKPGDAEKLNELEERWTAHMKIIAPQTQGVTRLETALNQWSAEAAQAIAERDDRLEEAEKLHAEASRLREQQYTTLVRNAASDAWATEEEAATLRQLDETLTERNARLTEVAQSACRREDDAALAFTEAWRQSKGFTEPSGVLQEIAPTIASVHGECQQFCVQLDSAEARSKQPDLFRRAHELKAKVDEFAQLLNTVRQEFAGDLVARFFPRRVAPAEGEDFSAERIASILQDRRPVADLCQDFAISEEMLLHWNIDYTGKSIDEIRQRLRAREVAPARRLKHQVEVELFIVEPMRHTGLAFVRDLTNRLDVVLGDIDLYSALANNGANYAFQLKELNEHRDSILATKRQACEILEALSPQATAQLDDDAIKRIWDERIVPIVAQEQARVLRAKRPRMKWTIDSKQVKVANCEGRRNEAFLDLVEMLDRETRREPRFARLWRWVTKDDDDRVAIWLYCHHPSQKWKCIYFRIGIDRFSDDVIFSIDSFVNIGLGSDPAQYKIGESKTFLRNIAGWMLTNENSKTFSTSNTCTVQMTRSVSAGEQTGSTNSVQQGTSVTENESFATSESLGTAQSDSWSNCASFSLPSKSQGTSFSVGGNDSRSFGRTNSTSQGKSVGGSYSRSTAVQASVNKSVSEAISGGFSSTDGISVSTNLVAFGADVSIPEKELLSKWQAFNPDAADIFTSVHHLFDAICAKESDHLQTLAKGTGNRADESLDACIRRVAAVMQVIYVAGKDMDSSEDIKIAPVTPIASLGNRR